MSGCRSRAGKVQGRGEVTASRERQTDKQSEKGFCFLSVTEALCVCCPTFGMPVHTKNAHVAGIAATAGGRGRRRWRRRQLD